MILFVETILIVWKESIPYNEKRLIKIWWEENSIICQKKKRVVRINKKIEVVAIIAKKEK